MDELNDREAMLTTVDNPWNPFTHFDEWYAHDIAHGHHSCSLLARFARTSNELSDSDNRIAINSAIDEILKFDFEKKFKRVYRNEN